jgi:hypothetical protein
MRHFGIAPNHHPPARSVDRTVDLAVDIQRLGTCHLALDPQGLAYRGWATNCQQYWRSGSSLRQLRPLTQADWMAFALDERESSPSLSAPPHGQYVFLNSHILFFRPDRVHASEPLSHSDAHFRLSLRSASNRRQVRFYHSNLAIGPPVCGTRFTARLPCNVDGETQPTDCFLQASDLYSEIIGIVNLREHLQKCRILKNQGTAPQTFHLSSSLFLSADSTKTAELFIGWERKSNSRSHG